MSVTSCGLDFGTSNSTLGFAGPDGTPRLVPLEGDKVTMPSVIFFSFEDGQTYFGRQALAEYVAGVDGRIMRSLKSILGTSLVNDRTRIKARLMAFTDILGLYLGRLRERSEAFLGTEPDSVVVGRPVHFVDDDPKADAEAQGQLEAAVRLQGFRHVEFQFEPIAAALHYEQQVPSEELALVVDIGGGTADFTVIRLAPERARSPDRQSDILSTAGVHIGGTDFDRLLSMARIMPHLGYQTPTRDGKRLLPSAPYYDLATWHRINRLYNQKTILDLRETRYAAEFPDRVDQLIAIIEDRQGHRLAAEVEHAKIELTDTLETRFAFESRGVSLAQTITRDQLGEALDGAVNRIMDKVAHTLKTAGVRHGDIQTLIMTGGSTQVPAITCRLPRVFPDARLVSTDAFGSVGLGLALDASRRF